MELKFISLARDLYTLTVRNQTLKISLNKSFLRLVAKQRSVLHRVITVGIVGLVATGPLVYKLRIFDLFFLDNSSLT